MTAKQRENRARFKAVVQEAKKLRMKNPKLTQAQAVKQAWAISYSKKRSGKEIGALPVSFTGRILDIPFKVFHQYDIYNNVTSIVEDTDNGATIVRIDGTGSIQSKADQFSSYIKNRSGYSSDQYPTEFPKRIKKFVSQLQEEVKKFNAGKSNTIKKIPVEIKPKKSTMAKKSVKSVVRKKVVKKKVATKKVAKQSGSSDRMRDMLYQAKKPGKRKTKWGTTYYESRANRSDKGRLLGTGEYHKDTKSHNVNIRVVSGYKKPMYSMGNVDTKKLLDQFAKESKLKKDVVSILKSKAKDYSNDYKSLLKDILYSGLQSGIISELVYYNDTLKWYNKHKSEIKMMLREAMMNYGTNNPADLFGNKWDQDDPFVEDTTNKNLLAWFSFEETAREISDKLGYEI